MLQKTVGSVLRIRGSPKTGKKSSDKTVMMTTEQLNAILERLTRRNRNHKSGTRKMRAFSPVQSGTEDVHMFGPRTKVDTNKLVMKIPSTLD